MASANPSVQQTELEPRFYPNKIARLALLSLEDVMGRNGVNALLNLAGTKHLVNSYPANDYKREFPFSDLSAIMEAMETMYGVRGARGMELRAGRYAFNLGLKEFGPLLGVGDLALKLMPMTIKMKITLNLTAQTFARFSDQPTRVEERKGQFMYIIEKCPVCWGRQTDRPCCYIAQGILEEALNWVTGGRNFKVQQIECRAMGNNECVWAIDKEPID
jgi:predicted hydrocarbon binding protein